MDDQILGGAMIHHLGNENREIKLLYFIAPEFQGKHIGTMAFKLLEDSFPNTKR